MQSKKQQLQYQVGQEQEELSHTLNKIKIEIINVTNSIRDRRQQLKQISETVEKQLHQDMTKKKKNMSHREIFQSAYKNNLTIYKEIQNATTELQKVKEKLSKVKDFSEVKLKNMQKQKLLQQKSEQTKRLVQQIILLKKQINQKEAILKDIQANSTGIKPFEEQLQRLRKLIKSIERQGYHLNQEDILTNTYMYELKSLIDISTNKNKTKDLNINQNQTDFNLLVCQVNQLREQKLKSEKLFQIEAKRMQEVIKTAQTKNLNLKIALREINNQYLRIQLQQKSLLKSNFKYMNTGKRSTATQLTPIKHLRIIPSQMEMGNFDQSPTSVILSDADLYEQYPNIQLTAISLYQDLTTKKIIGMEMKYQSDKLQVTGKNMISTASSNFKVISIDLANLISLTVQFDKQNIYCVKIYKPQSTEPLIIGTPSKGINRIVSLEESKISMIEVKLDISQQDVLNMTLKGLKLKLVKKTKPDASNNQILEEIGNQGQQKISFKNTKSHKVIIHKGPLKRLSQKQIIDHRLILSDRLK